MSNKISVNHGKSYDRHVLIEVNADGMCPHWDNGPTLFVSEDEFHRMLPELCEARLQMAGMMARAACEFIEEMYEVRHKHRCAGRDSFPCDVDGIGLVDVNVFVDDRFMFPRIGFSLRVPTPKLSYFVGEIRTVMKWAPMRGPYELDEVTRSYRTWENVSP